MNLHSFPDPKRAITFAVEQFVEIGRAAIAERGQFCVALSGGSTPEAIYRQLTAEMLDWSRVQLFWSDERAVAPDHLDSNYRMAMEAGLERLPVPPEQVHRMVAETDIEVHAAIYERQIKERCGGLFDLVMLGMGPDGHTASLFPETLALREQRRQVVPNYVPQKESWRMTLTFPCINQARHKAIYVLGAGKLPMLQQVADEKGIYPIEQVEDPVWISDQTL